MQHQDFQIHALSGEDVVRLAHQQQSGTPQTASMLTYPPHNRRWLYLSLSLLLAAFIISSVFLLRTLPVPSVQILRWHPLFTALWLSSLCILTSQAMIFPLRVLSICAGGLTLRQAATRCKDRRRTEKETIWQIRPYKREDTPLSSTFLLWSRSAGPGALWQSRYVEHRHSP